jgi:hypothetical protein
VEVTCKDQEVPVFVGFAGAIERNTTFFIWKSVFRLLYIASMEEGRVLDEVEYVNELIEKSTLENVTSSFQAHFSPTSHLP